MPLYASKIRSYTTDMIDIKRNMARNITKLLDYFPVVSLIGVRQCGKTTLSKQLLPDWEYIDLESPRDFELVTHDPSFFFQRHSQHLIIDEAQEHPELFRVLRGVVDERRQEKGRFLLTGSSSPELLNHISESLAGRVGICYLGTLKANEYYQKPLSSFYELFRQALDEKNLPTGEPPLTIDEMQHHWFFGGYPEPTMNNNEDFYAQWMNNYLNTYVNRDIAKLFPRLNKTVYQRFIGMLCQLSGTIINKANLARALEVSEGSVREYIHIAANTFIWRQLPSFEKNITKSIVKMPKGFISDSGLLHFMLGINSIDELYRHPIIGRSFESFVIEEIIKGLQSTDVVNWQPYYYRTRNGAEVDLILDGPFGTLPIEIKYGHQVNMRQLTSLRQFVKENKLPFGLLINHSTKVEWLCPEVVQVPVGFI